MFAHSTSRTAPYPRWSAHTTRRNISQSEHRRAHPRESAYDDRLVDRPLLDSVGVVDHCRAQLCSRDRTQAKSLAVVPAIGTALLPRRKTSDPDLLDVSSSSSAERIRHLGFRRWQHGRGADQSQDRQLQCHPRRDQGRSVQALLFYLPGQTAEHLSPSLSRACARIVRLTNVTASCELGATLNAAKRYPLCMSSEATSQAKCMQHLTDPLSPLDALRAYLQGRLAWHPSPSPRCLASPSRRPSRLRGT